MKIVYQNHGGEVSMEIESDDGKIKYSSRDYQIYSFFRRLRFISSSIKGYLKLVDLANKDTK